MEFPTFDGMRAGAGSFCSVLGQNVQVRTIGSAVVSLFLVGTLFYGTFFLSQSFLTLSLLVQPLYFVVTVALIPICIHIFNHTGAS